MIAAGRLERAQVLVYLAAIGVGLALGTAMPAATETLAALVLPVLAVLLFVTFLQVPLRLLPTAMRDTRFLSVALVTNFVLVPLLVAGLLLLVPDEVGGVDGALVRIGLVLVLVMPCTDWFLTFTLLARGDTARAIALTPVTLLLQLALLPVYLAVFAPGEVEVAFDRDALVLTVLALIVVPLLVAALTQWAAARARAAAVLINRAARLPVPLLALVLLLIAASQVGVVAESLALLPLLVGIFALYLVGAVVLGWLAARATQLPASAARTLVLSLATRNSFVVLPIALAVPEGAGVVAVVVVTQTLVELLGLAVLVRLVPRLLPSSADTGTPPVSPSGTRP